MNIAEYYAIDYFIFSLVQSVIIIILGLYALYVVPHEYGIASHPLFFLGFPFKNKNHDINESKRKNSDFFEEIG